MSARDLTRGPRTHYDFPPPPRPREPEKKTGNAFLSTYSSDVWETGIGPDKIGKIASRLKSDRCSFAPSPVRPSSKREHPIFYFDRLFLVNRTFVIFFRVTGT